jgi:hypothetical protein
MGLAAVKNAGEGAFEAIVRARHAQPEGRFATSTPCVKALIGRA